MAKRESYPAMLAANLALLDIFGVWDESGGFLTKKITIEEMNKQWATVTALAAASTGSFTFAQSATPSATQADETWLDTDDGKVYVSSGSGTGNWGTFIYQLVLNNMTEVSGITVNSVELLNGGVTGYLPHNFIINGDNRVNQRLLAGAVGANDGVYEAADLWKTLLNGITANIELVTSSQPSATPGSQSVKLTATSTASGKLGIQEAIENWELFAGKTVTFFCYLKSNKSSNVRLSIVENGIGNTATSQVHTGGGNWELFTFTVAVSAGISGLGVIPRIVASNGSSNVSITSGDYIEYTDVGMVLGSNAPPFIPRDLETETRKCQRYFYRAVDGSDTTVEQVGPGFNNSTTNQRVTLRYPVEMRIAPSLVVNDITDFNVFHKATTSTQTTNIVSSVATKRTIEMTVTVASGLTAGEGSYLRARSANTKLDFDAQL